MTFGPTMDQVPPNRTIAKVARRLIPFCILLFVVNYLDRVNIGFAALQMNQDLGFNGTAYGLGAGIFFIGYFLFEIPSNLILEKVGARRWLSRIAVTWGFVSVATAWVHSEAAFYVMRFLLGLTEAGLLPGILLYLSYWFPAAERGKALAAFMTATAISNVIGAPLSTSLLGLDGLFGFRGWQILFILEGLPSIVMGFLVLWFLTDQPDKAAWLDEDERLWLTGTLAAERTAREALGPKDLRGGLTDPRVLMITLLCFFLVSGNFGVVFWLPQIIKSLGDLNNMQVGLVTAIPYLLAVFAMVWWGHRSDRAAERKWHLAGAALLGAAGLAASAWFANPYLSFVALCVSAIGIWSMFGVFWAIPADFLSGTAAAGGFALINSVGNLGGFAGPFLVGLIRDRTGSFSAPLLVLSGFVFVAAMLAAALRVKARR